MSVRELTPVIRLVGSGTDAEARTSPYDCHVFLLDGGGACALVDTGTGLATETLLRHLDEGAALDRLTHVFVTHYHADHAGGAAAIRAATGAAVCTSTETAHALATGDEDVTQVAEARRVGVYPPDYRLAACRVDRVAGDGSSWQIGDLRVTAYASPGHCDGHLCFLVDDGRTTALCTGDSIFAGGRVSIQAIPDCRPYEYRRTASRLAGLPVDALLPGHLDLVLTGGAAHLAAAAETFDRLVPPANIV